MTPASKIADLSSAQMFATMAAGLGIFMIAIQFTGLLGDALAAFVNGEQRGLSIATEVPFGPYAGTQQFLMLIYSNEAAGEQVSFQFYDIETDEVYDIDESIEFISDMTLGTVVNPEILNVSLGVDIDVLMNSGWNWMSFNVYTEDMALNNMLSSLDDNIWQE